VGPVLRILYTQAATALTRHRPLKARCAGGAPPERTRHQLGSVPSRTVRVSGSFPPLLAPTPGAEGPPRTNPGQARRGYVRNRSSISGAPGSCFPMVQAVSVGVGAGHLSDPEPLG
jgi:hypothetical protein